MHRPSVPRTLRLVLPLAGLSAVATAAAPLPRFATHELTPLDCAQTPFGRQGLVGFGAAQRFEGFDESGAVEGGHKPTCKEVSVTSYNI